MPEDNDDKHIIIKDGYCKATVKRHFRVREDNHTRQYETEFSFDYPKGVDKEGMANYDKAIRGIGKTQADELEKELNQWQRDELEKVSTAPREPTSQGRQEAPREERRPQAPAGFDTESGGFRRSNGVLGQCIDYFKRGAPFDAYIKSVQDFRNVKLLKELNQEDQKRILDHCQGMDQGSPY